MSMCSIIKDDAAYWVKQPIECKKEIKKLVIITVIALTIIVLGLISYYLQKGKFDFIPGYNQGYAYFSWAVAGTIVAGTAAAYLAKAIISRQHAIDKK